MIKTLHFKIALFGIEPTIWRTFIVNDDYRMDRFHQVIQLVMGWTNSHLHEFSVNNRCIGMLMEDELDSTNIEDECSIHLRDLNLKPGDTFNYLYDFGDSWEHFISLEKVESQTDSHPLCTGGENASPPEDCGGFPGYMNIVDILGNPNHEEHDEMIEWLPEGYEPAFFPLETVNNKLDKFGKWHRKFPL